MVNDVIGTLIQPTERLATDSGCQPSARQSSIGQPSLTRRGISNVAQRFMVMLAAPPPPDSDALRVLPLSVMRIDPEILNSLLWNSPM
jgi:hypothetical protein